MPDVFISKNKPGAHKKPTHTQKGNRLPKVTQDRHHHPELKHQLEGHTKSPLSAFCYYPDHVDFIGADAEEKIVLLLRRHPITNLKWIVVAIVMLFAPFAFSFLPFIPMLPAGYQLFIIIFWYLLTTAFILEEFLSWFFNVYVVTDERVFDVDFHNLVYREITDANLDQIQDVTVRVGSVLRTMFDYGDVLIQTASELPQIEFEAVPNPDQVAQVLRELRVEEEIEKIEGRVR